MSLFNSVVYPVVAHIRGLRFLLAKFLSCDAHCSGIVNLDSRGYLFPSHFREGGADRYRFWVLTKMVLYSASAADAMVLRIILHITSKMPLVVGTKSSGFSGSGGPLLRKWTPLAWLLACATERYDVSECMANCIPLALY